MKHYTHINFTERCKITANLYRKEKITSISEQLGRHRSTIYREINRNKQSTDYEPSTADKLSRDRRIVRKSKLESQPALEHYVVNKLLEGWSPSQISGRLKYKNTTDYVSPETIYKYAYKDKKRGLYKLLPQKKAKRRSRSKRGTYNKLRSCIQARHISQRPAEASCRDVSGHWEGDTTYAFPRSKKLVLPHW